MVACALPDPVAGVGAVTALIGANNSGKTYTLESLRHALDATSRNKGNRIASLECTGKELPRFVYLGNNSIHMGKVGLGTRPCDLRHNIAVWQGYGLFGRQQALTGVSWIFYFEMPRAFVSVTNCQIEGHPFPTRPFWKVLNDSFC